MTILDLQDELAQEVGLILKDIVTTDASGEKVQGVTVHKQQLPVILSNEADADDLFPYALVEVYYGSTEHDETPWTVSTEIQVAVCDKDVSNQGHQHVAVMCQRIINRFCEEPLLAQKYRAQPEIEWAVQSEDSYPYFFGFVRIKFSVPKIGRRIPDYD